jgi:hypothetical protein
MNATGNIAIARTLAAHDIRVTDQGDAALLSLGEKLRAAWANEVAIMDMLADDQSLDADETYEAANAVCSELVEQIETLPARTLEGMKVKALAVSWCHSGAEWKQLTQGRTTDIRLAESILRDIQRLLPTG